jgi:serine protease AprX
LKLLAIRLPADALVELALEDSVDHVSLDDVVAASSVSSRVAANDPVYPSGNTAYTGDDTGVAILDSGVAYHPDLSSYIKQYDFLDGKYPHPVLGGDDIEKYNSSSRVDEYGHGTHIAGIISGRGKYSSGDYSGPATRSEIVSLRVLDSSGQGSMSDVMAALDWLLQYGSYFDIGVVNLSLGKPVTESNETDPLVLAIEQVWDEGMVVVVASGNFGREGYFSTTSPGNSRKVITVGSLTDNGTGADFSDDYVSTYSSKGPTPGDHVAKPDLVAPGNRLVATTPAKSVLGKLLPGLIVPCTVAVKCEYNYMTLSGTSMATGMVSAAAAMMLDKDSDLSPATVKARLMRSARKVDESPVVAGAGLLDIDAALNETGVVYGDALSPLLVYDAATGGTLIEDTSELWGNELWGAGYLWTDGSGISANGYVWTDGGVNANGYIWTDGSIWANGYLWTDGGIAAFGYLWTDGGLSANGYLWTDGAGVDANGYIWTDGLRGLALFDLYTDNPSLNDDEPTSD